MYRDDDAPGECFRVYGSPEESLRDHSDFLRYQDRYKKLFELDITDYKGWAKGLKAAGYATSPKYAEHLVKVIEDYQLYRFDTGVDPSLLPEAPLKIEAESRVQVKNPARAAADEVYTFSVERKVYRKNGVLCVYAEYDDSFASLALEFENLGVSVKNLLKYNDLPSVRPLQPGEIVYLAGKKKKGPDGIPMYVFGPEPESLWAVSQRFGVKLGTLEKMNNLPEGYVPVEGDVILLRK